MDCLLHHHLQVCNSTGSETQPSSLPEKVTSFAVGHHHHHLSPTVIFSVSFAQIASQHTPSFLSWRRRTQQPSTITLAVVFPGKTLKLRQSPQDQPPSSSLASQLMLLTSAEPLDCREGKVGVFWNLVDLLWNQILKPKSTTPSSEPLTNQSEKNDFLNQAA